MNMKTVLGLMLFAAALLPGVTLGAQEPVRTSSSTLTPMIQWPRTGTDSAVGSRQGLFGHALGS